MVSKLCLLCCSNFRPEVSAAVAAEGWDDVTVAAWEARCGHPPTTWDELKRLVPHDCAQVIILGRACVQGLNQPPRDWPSTRQWRPEQCFHLVAGPTLVAEMLARDAYLLTPAWLADWRAHVRVLGLAEENVAEFFHDFARELVLLDTGVIGDADSRLAELADVVRLPATRVPVGLDYVRQLLARLVTEWRLDEERKRTSMCEKAHARGRADHVAAMDFLARLALLTDEREAIAAIEDLFRMLFAPQQLHYVRFEDGRGQFDPTLPAALRRQIQALSQDWAWTESGAGFILRIAFADEMLGAVVAEQLALPAFRERYLNLALSVAGVCGLAIENARTYRRMKDAEEALRKSERSLTLAQAIAHLGHWEWDVNSEDVRWSEEAYRIFGYAPHAVLPSRDTFFQVIHPDDRVLVESHIRQARLEGRFDIEYRIVLPGGAIRVVRSVGEVVYIGADRQPRIIGTVQDLTPQEHIEVLGVVQDITERKELEWRLEQEARTDPLTGCANRRHFLQQAEQEVARVRRYGGALSVLMLDLDHFKRVNDHYGHHAGDATLRMLVEICKANLREEDLVGRLGGEEFAVMLPETAAERAVDAAERLRQAVAGGAVPVNDAPSLHVTASIGVATLEAAESVDGLLGRADRALYQAKNAGRNRVVAYSVGSDPS